MPLSPTNEADVADLIKQAHCSGTSLNIKGLGTKSDVGRALNADDDIILSGLTGITTYAPDEMIIEAYAGTPLAEIEAILAEKNQELPFEPSRFNNLFNSQSTGTIGGLIAMNISGARRVKVGAARDAMIGVRGVNGEGTLFKNGGRVMKNVTGYDLVKLMTGSYGTLGVMTHISLKVQPISPSQETMVYQLSSASDAVKILCKAMASPYDVTATAAEFIDGDWHVLIRLEGFDASVAYRREELKHELGDLSPPKILDEASSIQKWRDLQELNPISVAKGPIWLISVKPTDAPNILANLNAQDYDAFLDWSGGRIWIGFKDENPKDHSDLIRSAMAEFHGHATLIRGSEEDRQTMDVFQPLSDGMMTLTKKIKSSFDPSGILNPGKMYKGV